MIHLFTAGLGFASGVVLVSFAFPHTGLIADIHETRTLNGIVTEVHSERKQAVLTTDRNVKLRFSYEDIEPVFLRTESSRDGDKVHVSRIDSLTIGTPVALRFRLDEQLSATRVQVFPSSL